MAEFWLFVIAAMWVSDHLIQLFAALILASLCGGIAIAAVTQ
ncbi:MULTISPECIES: hypothetical protein [unclassified Bradyrhizobium]|nr:MULTISPECIES: hypothetical protein [unclassified Bradyrhizobium]